MKKGRVTGYLYAFLLLALLLDFFFFNILPFFFQWLLISLVVALICANVESSSFKYSGRKRGSVFYSPRKARSPVYSPIDVAQIQKKTFASKENKLPSPGKACEEYFLNSELITCAAYAPKTIKRGSEFLIYVFAHSANKPQEAEAKANAIDEDLKLKAFKTLETFIEQGSKLSFVMDCGKLSSAAGLKHIIWHGITDYVAFLLKIPSMYLPDSETIKITVYQQGVPIGELLFKIKFSSFLDEPKGKDLASVDSTKYHNVFISYASQDRKEVLKRVQLLRQLNINFFQDFISLDPGDRWQKELYRNIDTSDAFFLFWSTHSKESIWVKKEWKYALKAAKKNKLQKPKILPFLLEGPPVPAPPKELSHLHFDDLYLYLLKQ